MYKESVEKSTFLEQQLSSLETYKQQVTELLAANKDLRKSLSTAEKEVHKKAEERALKFMKDK